MIRTRVTLVLDMPKGEFSILPYWQPFSFCFIQIVEFSSEGWLSIFFKKNQTHIPIHTPPDSKQIKLRQILPKVRCSKMLSCSLELPIPALTLTSNRTLPPNIHITNSSIDCPASKARRCPSMAFLVRTTLRCCGVN